MTAVTDTTGPGQLIRWHYLGYALVALGVMTVAIVSHDHWFLNFVHVICGVLWTGIDLFMGFVIGSILRTVGLSMQVSSARILQCGSLVLAVGRLTEKNEDTKRLQARSERPNTIVLIETMPMMGL